MFVLDYFLIFHCHYLMHMLESSGKIGGCLLHIFTEVWEDELCLIWLLNHFLFFFFTSVFDSDTSQCQRMFSLVILAFHYSSKSLLCYVTVCLPCDRPLCLAQNTYLSLWSSDLLYTSLQRNSNKNLTKTEDKKSHFLVPDYRMTWLHSYGSVDPDYRKICCGLETGEAE